MLNVRRLREPFQNSLCARAFEKDFKQVIKAMHFLK